MSSPVTKSSKSPKSTAPAHKSASTTAAAADPAVTLPASAAAPPAPAPPTSAFAAKVIAQIDALEASLSLNIVLSPNDKNQKTAMKRVSDTAISLASEIVSAAPERFPDFPDLPESATYVQSIGQIGARAAELATHVQKSVENNRVPAATKTLALYAVVKGLGRITDNETMREKVPLLKAEVAPKRTAPKPKQTKGEKAVKRVAKANAKKLAKAVQVLAAAGIAVPSAPPAQSPAPTPPAATPSQPVGVASVPAVTPPAPPPSPTNGAPHS